MIPCEIMDLKKYYGKQLGVENVSFNIKEGEIIGFIGPNGAGKTTTIKSIVGLLKPTSGSIAMFNEDAVKSGEKVRHELGYSGSEASFFPNLTVLENLKFVADTKGVSYDKINTLATKLELNLTRKAKELSLGNKKKMMIVMALLSSPKLIILDEPTVGLDPLIKQAFFEIIEEILIKLNFKIRNHRNNGRFPPYLPLRTISTAYTRYKKSVYPFFCKLWYNKKNGNHFQRRAYEKIKNPLSRYLFTFPLRAMLCLMPNDEKSPVVAADKRTDQSAPRGKLPCME